MKASSRLALTGVSLFLAVGFVVDPNRVGAAPGDPPPCETTARLIQRAEKLRAQADLLVKAARILNDPGCDRPACVQEAKAERDEALDLIDEQYASRLSICEDIGSGPYAPDIDPDEFLPLVTNMFMPLVPGRTLVYESATENGLERDEFTALNDIETIDGFLVRKVRDIVTLDGEHLESTFDFFSQHENGDVWYFGEVSASFVGEFLDNLHGSWRAGRDEAKPGIVMKATPVPGDVYRQEFALGVAEDMARVIGFDRTVVVPFGTFEHCLETEEWSPSEPGVFERKFYAPGIGNVLVVDLDSGERTELVDIID